MNILIIYPHGNALNPLAGAETRIWNVINSLVRNKFNVFILHSINSRGSEDSNLRKICKVFYYRDLNFFGLSDWYFTDLNPFFIRKLLKIIRNYKIDVVQIEFPWGFIISKLLVKRPIILIYDSLGVESEFMKISFKHPKFPRLLKPLALFYAKLYERLVCKLADIIINVSEVDRSFFIEKYKIDKKKTFLVQIPSSIKSINLINIEFLRKESRKKLNLPLNNIIAIFHGGLPHPPNQEAIDIIINKIAPSINNDVLFVLAGYNTKVFRKNNVLGIGFVKDLKDLLLSADFAIVPIISGSGMRVKCSDYITLALPFISTKKGIEGIDFLENGVDCLIYNTINKNFLEGIRLLTKNKDLRELLHKNLVEKSKLLDYKKIDQRILKFYSRLCEY